MPTPRRQFLASATALATAGLVGLDHPAKASPGGAAPSVAVELPRCRVPLSFIIDDSTCLVNMGKFCMPQFAATYPERQDYQRPWQDWPDEIPDSFVREFGSWSAEHGVKGKYSIVPYPACVGWLDRTLPGWSQKQLKDSLTLVRELMVPNWDIHPEMITHTRVIDLKTGRPFADYSPAHMENSYPQEDVSVDYLASYLAYALRILKNCDLPCEGITTPGGFGNRVKEKLPLAAFEAVRDVYGVELPHYFKYVVTGSESTEPSMEAIRKSESGVTECCVNVPAGTGDWFGGWEGAGESQPDKYASADGSSGRMVELIQRRQPAVMLCHWPGMYCGGSLTGYRAFQRVVKTLNSQFKDTTQWMKVSDIGRYWAAKEFTQLALHARTLDIDAPRACPDFTLRIATDALGSGPEKVGLSSGDSQAGLQRVSTEASLVAGSYCVDTSSVVCCFDLPQGKSSLSFA